MMPELTAEEDRQAHEYAEAARAMHALDEGAAAGTGWRPAGLQGAAEFLLWQYKNALRSDIAGRGVSLRALCENQRHTIVGAHLTDYLMGVIFNRLPPMSDRVLEAVLEDLRRPYA